LTKLQLLERENKDLKTQIKSLKAQNKILEDLRKEDQKNFELKFELMNRRIDALYTDFKKVNERNAELEKENKELKDKIIKLEEDLEKANKTISSLKARIKKDSSNSSKPPSTDGFKKKIHNFREKTDKKVGGQPGHKGSRLELFPIPTEIIECKYEKCNCGGHINYGEEAVSIKQLVDIEVITKVTEFHIFEGMCSMCKEKYTSEFPENIVNTVQYGDNLKSLVAMLTNEGMVSINRTVDLVSSLTDGTINLSQGTVVNINYELAKNCEPIIAEIKSELIKAKLLCVDESGVRINGKLNWIHTACTDDATLYMVDKKRGNDATDNMGILAYFVGVLMHDHLKAYYNYKTMDHAECNVHILRYLKGIIEVFKREETEKFLSFLVNVNDAKKHAIAEGNTSFSEEKIEAIERDYTDILTSWQSK
jgi:cell division protein FtsB